MANLQLRSTKLVALVFLSSWPSALDCSQICSSETVSMCIGVCSMSDSTKCRPLLRHYNLCTFIVTFSSKTLYSLFSFCQMPPLIFLFMSCLLACLYFSNCLTVFVSNLSSNTLADLVWFCSPCLYLLFLLCFIIPFLLTLIIHHCMPEVSHNRAKSSCQKHQLLVIFPSKVRTLHIQLCEWEMLTKPPKLEY